MYSNKAQLIISAALFLICQIFASAQEYKSYSGIYPHLAFYNNEGECGTGAVVPWGGSLWAISYGPHFPNGSSDKLYEIESDLEMFIRPESIGGTPANRMIHKESGQLFIGPYAIDSASGIRVIPYSEMYGRHTGNARHLSDPANKIYYGTMEEGFYEVDVHSLEPTTLYKDGNLAGVGSLLPGTHGKGLYSGQGVMIYANNGGGSGVLAEWESKAAGWKTIRQNRFCEVTGPGGIYGNPNPETDPVWATGWDDKSLLLGLRDKGEWSFYRMPRGSHTYDASHGWYTEWPRIRSIGTDADPEYLMTMHGMFWHFPATFSASNTFGIRPRSAYLKIAGDFTRWKDQLVIACDDACVSEGNVKRNIKGNMAATGQSNSNLWFTSLSMPDSLGTSVAEGSVWLSEALDQGQISDPILFAGWDYRSAWIKNEGSQTILFTFEIDEQGNNNWQDLAEVPVEQNESVYVPFESGTKGEWIRVSVDKSCSKASVHFSYAQEEKRSTTPDPMFNGFSEIPAAGSKAESKAGSTAGSTAGLLWGLSGNARTLGVLAGSVSDTKFTETGYYELNAAMNLVKKNSSATANYIRNHVAIPEDVLTIDEASVLIVDEEGQRWRLPKNGEKYQTLAENALSRICREVVTQRDLVNCAGTFYELPREDAGGFAKIRPISSHNFHIHDYASYRGMLIMTGLDADAPADNPQIIRSDDGKAMVWAGVIDDLWKLGKPSGYGGPWKDTRVSANIASDPYLIASYDKRHLELSHGSSEPVTFTIEVDPAGNGSWMNFRETTVNPGDVFEYEFSPSFQARWIRFTSDRDCIATAMLNYQEPTSAQSPLLNESLSIQLYPNPASTNLLVSSGQGNERQGKIEIFTLQGTKIHQSPREVLLPCQVDVSAYQPGIYLVRINIEGQTFTKKVVKE